MIFKLTTDIPYGRNHRDIKGKPLFYAINCTHVSDILPLFVDKEREPWMERLVEVMANPSTKVRVFR